MTSYRQHCACGAEYEATDDVGARTAVEQWWKDHAKWCEATDAYREWLEAEADRWEVYRQQGMAAGCFACKEGSSGWVHVHEVSA